nr:hypothetical protein [uncultured Carboxylicivirga sp.]
MKCIALVICLTIIVIGGCSQSKKQKYNTTQKRDSLIANQHIVGESDSAMKKEAVVINYKNLIPSAYDIEYHAKGDLNSDGADDLALVIKRKENFKGNRKVLVFIKENDKYRLDKTSEKAFPNKFMSPDNDTESYYQEGIYILNQSLVIKLYGAGPIGNNFSTYKYTDMKLLLTGIETYDIGAGSEQSLYYDLLQSKLLKEITDLLSEEAKTIKQEFKLSKKEIQFEDCNPIEVMIEAYNKTEE